MNADRRHVRGPAPRALLRRRPPALRRLRAGLGRRAPALRHTAVARRLAWAVSSAAALALVALGAQTGRNAACATTLTGPYGGGGGAVRGLAAGSLPPRARPGDECSLAGAVRDDLLAAVSAEEYAGSAACGAYLDVAGPLGVVRVQVVGRCRACAPGEVDLSGPAYARIAYPGRRAVPVGYRTVRNPAVAMPVAFRLRPGSSAHRLSIQVVDHGNPLVGLEVMRDGRWAELSRDAGNYWVAEHGAGPGPFVVRVTDVYGQRLTASGIRLTGGGLQRTPYRLYAPAEASPPPPARTATGRRAAPVPPSRPSPVPLPAAGDGTATGHGTAAGDGTAAPRDTTGSPATGTRGVPHDPGSRATSGESAPGAPAQGPRGPSQGSGAVAHGPGVGSQGPGAVSPGQEGRPLPAASAPYPRGSGGRARGGAFDGGAGGDLYGGAGGMDGTADGTAPFPPTGRPDDPRRPGTVSSGGPAPLAALPSAPPFFC
ncbi:hypothetical protein Skr01_01660 [Sphaerisporangium krabiense]|uniref:Expansin-like EG45 domain-containing protein n=1 Tax=Sphaerisporangium krabiense TaxID=763782 RepID=A0A7W9DT63_9ACTN|nr:expansin EXLX1 family cellulose-binding protein [Sphaerisporangium krabiense]MBB5629080.1 hypothetical protein [Sphaerisporangium krabiense]GII60081.1 hypothetical protein Skr01_01660 [Sphaerisporangium krabiense]